MIKSYVVRAGDHLAKIAHNVGLDPDVVWNHPKNEELRGKRPDKNILCEGDVIFLPVKPEAPLPLKVGQSNRYSVIVAETTAHVRFGDTKGPFANEAFVVRGLDEPVDGTTDGDGALTVTAPVTVRSVKICFEKRGLTFSVLLGDMDPISEVSGVQARLCALGYRGVASTGELDRATTDALREFQTKEHLSATGAIDEATIAALQAAYGC